MVIFDDIICSSVRFCNNLLLKLRMRFKIFYLARKEIQEFSNDRKILILLLSAIFLLYNHV